MKVSQALAEWRRSRTAEAAVRLVEAVKEASGSAGRVLRVTELVTADPENGREEVEVQKIEIAD